MNITEFMQFIHSCEHLADIVSRMLFFEHPRIVKQRPEIAPGYVFHSEVDVFRVLECIKEFDEPWRFGSSQNVTFYQDMTDLKNQL